MMEHQFWTYIDTIRSFCKSVSYVYLYGAGTYAQSVALLLQKWAKMF